MKKVLIVLAAMFAAFLVLGFLFVRWANRPENVQAVLEHRKEEAAQKEAAEKRKVELAKEIAEKKASLKLVADESFADNRLHWLESDLTEKSGVQFEEHKLKYNTTITKGQGALAYHILGKDELTDFVAEVDSIFGSEAYAGIVWTNKGADDEDGFQAAYSSPSYLFVRTDGTEHFKLGGFISAESNQKIRVERFSESLKVSVNDKVLFDGLVPPQASKVGLYLGHGGGVQSPTAVSITVKQFKIWKHEAKRI